MSHFIDRRLYRGNRSVVNRGRFIRRYKARLKRSVADAVNKRSITDMDRGENVRIPSKDMREPTFGLGPGGTRDMVYPGNREYMPGDRIDRPEGGGNGSGRGSAGGSGQGEDDFVFELSREEFLDLLFDDLELPNLVRNQFIGVTEFNPVRAGFSPDGIPSNMDIPRSVKNGVARRIALGGPDRARIRELEEEIDVLFQAGADEEDERIMEMREEIDRLRGKIQARPFIDSHDSVYRAYTKQPKPVSQAVMLCIMDTSGSMDQLKKNLAKRFFILLYLFLQGRYEKIEVVFIRHHEKAQEVDEEEFFYSKETGGTVVSSALNLAYDIVRERYDTSTWNIYCAQASDGDNEYEDSQTCREILTDKLMPLVRYWTYVSIRPNTTAQSLWHAYAKVREVCPNLSMDTIREKEDVYPAFREFFKRQEA